MIEHEHVWRDEKCIFCGLYQLIPTQAPPPKQKKTRTPRVKREPEFVPAKTALPSDATLLRMRFLKECLERAERLDLPIQARLYRAELARLA